jgi:hypothetical protein
MRFQGGLVFHSAEQRDAAAGLLRRAERCLVGPDGLEVRHLMLAVELDQVAPSALWETTALTLQKAARKAWAGAIQCTYGHADETETDWVVAAGKRRADAHPDKPHRASVLWKAQRSQPEIRANERAGYRFEFDDCKVLTFYVLAHELDEPGPETPSFVHGLEPDGMADFMYADVAPYITSEEVHDLAQKVCRERSARPAGSVVAEALDELLAWIERTGAQMYGYQLEPPLLAGDGTARRLGLEAESRGAGGDDEDDEDDEDDADDALPDPPWPASPGGGHRCPACGSSKVETRHTTALGYGLTEARCDACSNFGSWED